MYTYQVKRTHRKSLKLSITPDAEILVEAPLNLRQEVIEQFVQKYEEWIEQHLKLALEQKNNRAQWLESVPFMGKEYAVHVWQEKEILLTAKEIYLPESTEPQQERKKVIAWYKSQAKAILGKRAAYWAQIMQCKYTQLKISSAKKRWGSCNSQGHIAFSWRLMQAPPEAIDYVIIHELAHLQILDHSPAFWERVKAYCPDYKNRKQLLVQVSDKMQRQGWNV